MVILSPDKRLLALTFDPCETSGEVAGYDGAIIDYLRAHRVKATFFAGGRWMASHSERTQRLLSDPLFEVGTHGELWPKVGDGMNR
jgi:peptidoglycan/xylan/chitin deacetylase (PgdA/CDA1 family)